MCLRCLAYASCQRSCMHEYHPKQREPSTPLPARMAGPSRQPWLNCCRGDCRRPASPARSPSFRSVSNERSWRSLERMWSCTKPSWHWRASSSARESVSRGVQVSCQPRRARHKKDRRGSPSGDVSCVLGWGQPWVHRPPRQVPTRTLLPAAHPASGIATMASAIDPGATQAGQLRCCVPRASSV